MWLGGDGVEHIRSHQESGRKLYTSTINDNYSYGIHAIWQYLLTQWGRLSNLQARIFGHRWMRYFACRNICANYRMWSGFVRYVVNSFSQSWLNPPWVDATAYTSNNKKKRNQAHKPTLLMLLSLTSIAWFSVVFSISSFSASIRRLLLSLANTQSS